jgi:hypothetical protein
MAGKAKSVYLTILPRGQLRPTILHKVFFDARGYNDYVRSEEFKLKYPPDQFDIVKEVY